MSSSEMRRRPPSGPTTRRRSSAPTRLSAQLRYVQTLVELGNRGPRRSSRSRSTSRPLLRAAGSTATNGRDPTATPKRLRSARGPGEAAWSWHAHPVSRSTGLGGAQVEASRRPVGGWYGWARADEARTMEACSEVLLLSVPRVRPRSATSAGGPASPRQKRASSLLGSRRAVETERAPDVAAAPRLRRPVHARRVDAGPGRRPERADEEGGLRRAADDGRAGEGLARRSQRARPHADRLDGPG